MQKNYYFVLFYILSFCIYGQSFSSKKGIQLPPKDFFSINNGYAKSIRVKQMDYRRLTKKHPYGGGSNNITYKFKDINQKSVSVKAVSNSGKILDKNFDLSNDNLKANSNRSIYTYGRYARIDNMILVEYDSIKQLPSKITHYDEFLSTTIYEFDYFNNKYDFKHFRSYNKTPEISETRNYNSDITPVKLNSKGDIIEIFWASTKKGADAILKNNIKYDEKGNWIKQERFLKWPDSIKKVSKITRQIKY